MCYKTDAAFDSMMVELEKPINVAHISRQKCRYHNHE